MKKIKPFILRLCICAVLSMELVLLADIAVVFVGKSIPMLLFVVLWSTATLTLAVLFRMKVKYMLCVVCLCPLMLGLVISAGYICWKGFSNNADYLFPDAGKHQIYGERRVMLIVPHQDDDINILGGVMEEYVRYGSELYAVFVTNGDYEGLTEIRYAEAIRVFERMGVSKDHVIFLGYGDNWKDGGAHIYNAESGLVMESHWGRTETYGTATHPAYREGNAYTIDNLTEDLKNVILEYRPDVIFCSDYDHHIDHKATTLLFDKVMGKILKENPDYMPAVYKAYAYGTAWEAEADYYADNILSTANLFAEPYSQNPAVYRWEDRVRFPVSAASLSRSLVGSEGYALLDLYDSQDAGKRAARVVNGDKVAWRRYTDSLCLHAEITSTSGQTAVLNDFMLIENHDLRDETHLPYDGIWIPDPDDDEKMFMVTLQEPGEVYSIILYDHPSEIQNVRNAQIVFDDGTILETGPLDPGGAATVIPVRKNDVRSFSVVLAETEGDQAGLSEVEAFAQEPGTDGKFLKLMDAEGNFLYDYQVGPDGSAELSVYTYGDLPELSVENYFVNTDSDTASAVLEDGVIRAYCPAGESFTLNITCNTAGVSDSVYIRNPGLLERMWYGLWQNVEQQIFTRYAENYQERLLIIRVPKKLMNIVRRLI